MLLKQWRKKNIFPIAQSALLLSFVDQRKLKLPSYVRSLSVSVSMRHDYPLPGWWGESRTQGVIHSWRQTLLVVLFCSLPSLFSSLAIERGLRLDQDAVASSLFSSPFFLYFKACKQAIHLGDNVSSRAIGTQEKRGGQGIREPPPPPPSTPRYSFNRLKKAHPKVFILSLKA